MENVRGHLSLGFGRVLGDLAEIGYDAEWQVIPAAAVGAPHKRDRVFIVAYPNDTGNRTPERRIDYDGATQIKKQQIFSQFGVGRRGAEMADANGPGGWGVGSLEHGRENVFRKSDQLRGQNGFTSGSWWEVEPSVGRVADGVSDRVDRLKGLGNAIVPQVAELVGALVVEHLQN